MTKTFCFEFWSLDIAWNLVLVIWNFLVRSTRLCFPFLRVLRCFTSPGIASRIYTNSITNPHEFYFLFIRGNSWPDSCKFAMSRFYRDRFPHSEIPGSQVAKHLPEAYRSHATSFIAFRSQDILHLLLKSYPVYQLRQNFSKEINIAKRVEVVLPGLTTTII